MVEFYSTINVNSANPESIMNRFDQLLIGSEEFRAHIYHALKAALIDCRRNLKPSNSRKERVGAFVNALRRYGLSLGRPPVIRSYGKYHYDRFFPGITENSENHTLAKHLARELSASNSWREPGILSGGSIIFAEGSEIEKLTQKAMRDYMSETEQEPDFSGVREALDTMKSCLEDTKILTAEIGKSSNKFNHDLTEIEKEGMGVGFKAEHGCPMTIMRSTTNSSEPPAKPTPATPSSFTDTSSETPEWLLKHPNGTLD